MQCDVGEGKLSREMKLSVATVTINDYATRAVRLTG